MVEQEYGDGFDVNLVAVPDEVKLRVFSRDNLPALNYLYVQRVDAEAGLSCN